MIIREFKLTYVVVLLIDSSHGWDSIIFFVGQTTFVAFARSIMCDVKQLGLNQFFVGLTTLLAFVR